MLRRTLSSLLLVALVGLALPAGAEQTAQQVVQETSDSIAGQLKGREAEYAANKKALYQLIDRELLPKFDVDYAGRLVLGKAWRSATPAQREKFVDVFYNFLLRSYSTAILKFKQDDIRILPPRAAPKNGKTTVHAEFRMEDGSMVPVAYAMRSTPDGWKAYDVRIEGISYVQTYRNQFNAEVAAKGLDALIGRLEKETAEIDAGRREPERLQAPAATKSNRT
jgi:phospholipid transport system substrate-binding protein